MSRVVFAKGGGGEGKSEVGFVAIFIFFLGFSCHGGGGEEERATKVHDRTRWFQGQTGKISRQRNQSGWHPLGSIDVYIQESRRSKLSPSHAHRCDSSYVVANTVCA